MKKQGQAALDAIVNIVLAYRRKAKKKRRKAKMKKASAPGSVVI